MSAKRLVLKTNSVLKNLHSEANITSDLFALIQTAVKPPMVAVTSNQLLTSISNSAVRPHENLFRY